MTPEGSSCDNMNIWFCQTETDITNEFQERGLPVVDDLLENQVMVGTISFHSQVFHF